MAEARQIRLNTLEQKHADAFLQAHWSQKSRRAGDQATMAALLCYLQRSNAIPFSRPAPCNDIGLLEEEYKSFLLKERGLMQASVEQYVVVVRRFLSYRFPRGKLRLKRLKAKHVTNFVLHDTSTTAFVLIGWPSESRP